MSDIEAINRFDKIILNNKKDGNTFLVINLKINKDNTALLTFREDSNTPILYKQQYDYTDISKYFDGEELKFYLIDDVLLLESEY
jgi:hypothetical protein